MACIGLRRVNKAPLIIVQPGKESKFKIVKKLKNVEKRGTNMSVM